MAEDKTKAVHEARLGDIGVGVEKAENRSSMKVAAGAAAIAALVGGGIYLGSMIDTNGADTEPVRQTSSPSEFQEGGSFGALKPVAAVEPRVVKDPAQDEALRALENRLSELTGQMAQLASAKDTSSQAALDALKASMLTDIQSLKDKMTAATTDADETARKLRQTLEAERKKADAERSAWDAQRRSLDAQLRSAQNQPIKTGPSDEEIARQKQQAMLDEQKRQQEALLLARVNSGMIAFTSTGGAKAEAESRKLTGRESFVAGSAKPVAVSVSSKIARPEITVVQGTIIQAALETAIDSSLPGTLRAVVSEDVHSFDGRNVLIPRGSKLFGEYQSDLTIADSRILVAWNRVVTPEGRTAVISSYGADDLGRSGTTGQVYRHFLKRFGAAAMISIIGAVPTLASNGTDNEAAQTALENVGTDLSSQTASVIGEYLSIPPTIRVDQGVRISVILDRDVVLP